MKQNQKLRCTQLCTARFQLSALKSDPATEFMQKWSSMCLQLPMFESWSVTTPRQPQAASKHSGIALSNCSYQILSGEALNPVVGVVRGGGGLISFLEIPGIVEDYSEFLSLPPHRPKNNKRNRCTVVCI